MEKEDVTYYTSHNKTLILKMYMNVVIECVRLSISGALIVNVLLQCFSNWLIPLMISTHHYGI